MKTRELVFFVSLMLLLFVGWQFALRHVANKHPEWYANKPTTAPSEIASTQSTQTTIPTTQISGIPSTNPIVQMPVPQEVVKPPVIESPAESILLGSDAKEDPTYALRLQVTSRGAGVESVVLNNFKQVVNKDDRYTFQMPVQGHEDVSRPLSTQKVWVNGGEIDLSKINWAVKEKSATKVTFETSLQVVRVYKTFEIFPRSGGQPGSVGYEVNVTFGFENLTDAPAVVKTQFAGVVVPPREQDTGVDRQVLAGFNDVGRIEIEHHLTDEWSSTPSKDVIKNSKDFPLAWAGLSSVYFNAIVRPVPLGQTRDVQYLNSVKVESLNPGEKHDQKLAMKFETKDLTLAGKASTELPMKVYFGPRQRAVLNNEYYAGYPMKYDQTLVLTSGPCGFCVFPSIISGLVYLLNIFHFILRDWGLAIIALVFLVRTCLHPVTKRAQVNMMGMQKLGPEIERLKKKYADDKDELNRQIMAVYKTQGFTPILGCLPMLLQTPIWIALWNALQSTFELRHAPFLQFESIKFTWINDLARPDHLISWDPVTIFFGWTLTGFNILPILLAVVFWLNQKYTPKPPATTPEQEQQQKMMQWMSLLFPVFLYNGPAGLNLYFLTSTTLGIIENKIIRKHIKEKEEAEKNGVVIVDAKPGEEPPLKGAVRRKPEPPKPQGGIMGWIADIQKKAEEMAREQQKRKGK